MPSTNPARRRLKAADALDDELVRRSAKGGVAAAFRWLIQSRRADGMDAARLGALHERLLDSLHGSRRRTGAYYTPPALVELLLDYSLEPVLAAKTSAAVRRAVQSTQDLRSLSADERVAAAEAILSTTVLDPACGAGIFLEAAAERLFAWLRPVAPAKVSECELRNEIARQCLFGVDLDETAAMIARRVLGGGDIHHGNSLLEPSPWPGRRFDVVVGNPPFANAIEGLISDDAKKQLSALFPGLRGTADLAFYFLAAAHEFAAPSGSVGLVLPRTVLSAPAAARLRERLLRERPPAFLQAPADPLLFPGANIFVALVALRLGAGCSVAVEDGSLRRVHVDCENWWRALHRSHADEPNANALTVGDLFEVCASMTAGQAYALVPHLMEGGHGTAPKFVTTGLIDPGVCHWGTKTCRYLGRKFQRPTVDAGALPADLAHRVSRMRRPKVLVAGLSTRVEAFLDAEGNHLGAVSTYSLFHPEDDLEALARLCDLLNSDAAADLLRRELGATALGGGRITLTKRFLKGFPLG